MAEQQGRCAPARPEILAQYTQAFEGTVTGVEGDTVTLHTPAGAEELEIAAVRYQPLATGPSDGRG